MFTDAHCHPFDLSGLYTDCEKERRRLGVLAAASACDMTEFTHNTELAFKAGVDKTVAVLPCFGIHPQLPAFKKARNEIYCDTEINENLETLHNLARAGKITAVGECGFDLYNAVFRETEALQDRLFAAQIDTALNFELPVVIHLRRAMRKVFAAVKTLAKCKAVVFHSWAGSFNEGEALLKRGVNAFFSFGNPIRLNHKEVMRCCSIFPAGRLLSETDAPFQPPRGQNYSQWSDLPLIIETSAALRREAGSSHQTTPELEARIEANFKSVFF
ncbi:MAG: TatD family hydrolase [Treponema sp.]|jgi:TatD DNase family protein|nr:TatD family hydrolase [Treponema sp.]